MANVNLGGFSPLPPNSPRSQSAPAPAAAPAQAEAQLPTESVRVLSKTELDELNAFVRHQIQNYKPGPPPTPIVAQGPIDFGSYDAVRMADLDPTPAQDAAPKVVSKEEVAEMMAFFSDAIKNYKPAATQPAPLLIPSGPINVLGFDACLMADTESGPAHLPGYGPRLHAVPDGANTGNYKNLNEF